MSGIIGETGSKSGVIGVTNRGSLLPIWQSSRAGESAQHGSAQKITFEEDTTDNYFLNVGNCMNTSTDTFTCSLAGYYECQFQSVGSGGTTQSDMSVSVKRNGTYVNCYGYCSGGDDQNNDGGHHMHNNFFAIIKCNVGDTLEFWLTSSGFIMDGTLTGAYIKYLG